jgi:hypothetical protein
MAGVKAEYKTATDGRQTFDQMVKYETSGVSQDEIKELVTHGGKLEDAQELFYATEGAGTDEDKLKEVLKGKTPAQIEVIRQRYAELHKGRTLDDDILGDLSGREDLDVGHTLKYGDPDTFAQQLDEEKDPEKRKKLLEGMKQMLRERRDFEESGTIGQIFALGADPMNSADQLEEAVKRADLYNTALTSFQERNKGKKPEEIQPDPLLTAARANFEMTYGGTLEAQEQVRAQIDSYADAIAQVGAAVAGIAVTVATFGAAGPVVAALYGAAASAAMAMALKANLKGAAYSWEEAGVDLAVGAIDAAVSAATAGASKAISGALAKAAAAQAAKMAAKEGAEKASESVVKAYLKEAMKEVLENAIQAMPTAAAQAMLDDNTWKSDDPWGSIGMATLKGAGTGAAVGLGMKGAKDLAGAGIKGIKGALKGKGGGIEVGGIKAGGGEHVKAGDLGGGTKLGTEPGEVRVGGDAEVGAPKGEPAGGVKETADVEPKSATDIPEKPTDLPQAADPDVAAKAAEDGKLPEGTHPPDPAKTELHSPDAKADGGTTTHDTPHGKVDGETGRVEGTPAEAAPARKPSSDDVGKALSMDDLKNRYGMPEGNVKKIKAIADEHGVIIDIRPTTPHAEPMLREGTALPKPEKLKAKTINEVDVQIGLGKPEDLGKVGFFEPKEGGAPRRPDNYEALPEKQKKAIDDRIKQRKEEFADYRGDMDKLVGEKLITIQPDGTVINQGLSKGEKGLPFTGDHDVFDIRAKDGTKLSPEKYQAVKQALLDADAGIMHGGVTGWEVDSPKTFHTEAGQKSYGKMVADHSPGGKEPLVRIGDGDPKGVWYEPAAPAPGSTDAGAAGTPHAVPDPKAGGAAGTPDPADPAGRGAPSPVPDPAPEAPGPRAGGGDPAVDTKLRDDIDAATGVKKGAGYESDMAKLREQYEAQAREAQNVTEVRTTRTDPISDHLGNPITFPDGRPWGYQIQGAFEVRRFQYEGGGLSQVTIKVAVDAKAGVGLAELNRLKADVHAGVDAHYNSGRTLPNGDRLNVQVEFVPKGSGEHLTIEVGMKGVDTRADQTHWFVGDDPTVHAHELGHQMGLLDEYIDPRAINRSSPTAPGVKTDNSLMGNFWSSSGGVEAGTSLKERHLAQIGGDIDAARAGTATATPAPAGPRAPAPDVNVPPMPEMSTAQMDRMADLHQRVGGKDGWGELGFHSVDDMKRHFAKFGSVDDALADLEARQAVRETLGGTAGTGPDKPASTAKDQTSAGEPHGAHDEALRESAEGTDEPSYWEAQALGQMEPDALPPEIVNPTDLPEYRASIEEASGKFGQLTNIEQGKNVALGGADEQGLSGWRGDQAGATERARQEGIEAGHETEPHMFDPKGSEGQYESSHSERKAAAGTTDQHFASSKDMCPRCQDWFAWRARSTGMPQFVGDPSGVRVFLPDGKRLLVPHPSGADLALAGH